MKLPNKWADVTVGQFIEATEVLKEENFDINNPLPETLKKEIALIAIMGKTTRMEVEALPQDELKRYAKQLSFFANIELMPTKIPLWFTLNGKIYDVQHRIDKMTAGQGIIDLSNYCKGDVISNIHNLLAVVCVPRKTIWKKGKYDGAKHNEVAQKIYDSVSIAVAYPLALFFCKVLNELPNHIATSLEPMKKELEMRLKKAVMDGMNKTDG